MKIVACLLVLMVFAVGCETYLDETKSGALVGSGLGAGLGAIIGNQTGHAGAGTAIGAGAGALAGALAGRGIQNARTANQNTQYAQTPQYAPQQTVATAQRTVEPVHTKFSPTTGKTYPESYEYDPIDGTKLEYIR